MSNAGSPVFKLTLGGSELTAGDLKHVLSVEFKEALDQLDSLTVQLAVPESSDDVLKYAEAGVEFVVQLGYDGSTYREIYGDIIEVSHSRSTTAPWVVTLQGLDKMHRFKKKRASKKWEGSHSDIVEAIAGELGLTAEVEGTEDSSVPQVQLNTDYASILADFAKKNNYFVRIEGDGGKTLRFGRKSSEYQDTVSLVWGEQIESVSMKYSLNDIITKVTVKGYDYTQDKWIEGVATGSDVSNISGGDSAVDLAQKAFGDVELMLDNSKENQTSTSKARALGELKSKAEKFVTGTVKCVGVPDAVAGAKLTISKAGWPISGNYLIKESTHTLDPTSGYTTSITFYSDSLPQKK